MSAIANLLLNGMLALASAVEVDSFRNDAVSAVWVQLGNEGPRFLGAQQRTGKFTLNVEYRNRSGKLESINLLTFTATVPDPPPVS